MFKSVRSGAGRWSGGMVRIPRDAQTRMHPQADGLFPCGEGAGFAGGIMSAAMDGERSAEAAAVFLGVTTPD